MKGLFIGGTGIISSAVSKLAVEKGIDLYLFNRGQHREFVPKGARIIKGDIKDKSAFAKSLKGKNFDVVVDWLAYVPKDVEADIKIFKGNVGQYIFISSASAYQKPTTHWLITESTPLANPFWQYSRDKIACEDRLMAEYRDNGFPITIVRPSFTYGINMIPAAINSWSRPWTIVDRMRKGKKIIIHGDGTTLWTMTHNTDFAKGFVGLLGNIQAIGHAFHITSDEVLTWNQVYQAIADAAGAKLKPVYIPSDVICKFNPDLTGTLLGDKSWCAIFDNSKIKRLVPDFVATVPFAQGVKRSIEWFEADPKRCTVDDDYNDFMNRLIATYEKILPQ
ncbi:MAG: SDR family oxidoreductase [Sedimentisphaerales bacterium]|nr:SDR family oxidoreductase [Sedimentisphaerales bacterium]